MDKLGKIAELLDVEITELMDDYNLFLYHNQGKQLLPALANDAGATDELKATDQMKWVGLMNACRNQAEEIINTELIYN